MPVGFQRKATIDVELDARNIEVERNVQAQAQQATTQVHVELDRIHARLGQHLAGGPGRDTHTVGVVEGHIHVGQRDVAIGVEVLEDAQVVVENLVQRLLDQLHRLARTSQFAAQIQQQTAAQARQHLTGVGQALSDEGQVSRQTTLEQILYRTQTQIDAVKDKAWVIEQVDQRVLPHLGQVQIRQAQVQREGVVWLSVAHQQIKEFGQTLIAVFWQSAQHKITDRHVAPQQVGRGR